MLRHYTTTAGSRTTIHLDAEWWAAIDRLSGALGLSWAQWVRSVEAARPPGRSLAAWIRVSVLREAVPDLIGG